MSFSVFFTIAVLSFFLDNCLGLAFENCNDGYTPHNATGCTTIQKDGGLGSESINSVLLNECYLDNGRPGGCPYDYNACSNGFSWYGFVKFISYPKTSYSYGVIVSTNQFNVHILSNGHMVAYAWMATDREWYAETSVPMLLGVYYPHYVSFYYNALNGSGSLMLATQHQITAWQNSSRPRTYAPPTQNYLFGGDGSVKGSYANIQLDRARIIGNYMLYNDMISEI